MMDNKLGNNFIGKGVALSLPYGILCNTHWRYVYVAKWVHNTVVQFNISFQRDYNLVCYSLTVTHTDTYTYVATC